MLIILGIIVAIVLLYIAHEVGVQDGLNKSVFNDFFDDEDFDFDFDDEENFDDKYVGFQKFSLGEKVEVIKDGFVPFVELGQIVEVTSVDEYGNITSLNGRDEGFVFNPEWYLKIAPKKTVKKAVKKVAKKAVKKVVKSKK